VVFARQLTEIRQRTLATLLLSGIGLISTVIYITAFLLPANLLMLYDQPRLDLSLLFQKGTWAYVQLIVAFVILGLSYWAGYRITSRQAEDKTAWRIVLGFMFVFIIIFLFMAPFDAADIYDNIMHGRITGIYNANPFRQVIADYPHDPFYRYAAWKQSQSAYGPLWEMLASLTARLSGDGIISNVIAFKFLPGLFHLASMGIVYVFLKNKAPDKALSGVLLLGWNPVLLYETWGNGHNDMAMTFWFLLVIWLISKRHFTLAALSLLLGALIKFIPMLLIPVVGMIAWREIKNAGQRLLFFAKTAIIGSLLTGLLYFPFWDGYGTLDIGRRMQLFTTSIPSVLYKALKPVSGTQPAGQIVSLASLGLLLLFVLHQSLSSSKSDPEEETLQKTFNILTFYLLVVCLWFHQWYGLWLITLSPLLSKRDRIFALLFGFWVLSQKLWFGPKLVPKLLKATPGQAVWLEILLALGVLGIPWLYASWNLWESRRMRIVDDAA